MTNPDPMVPPHSLEQEQYVLGAMLIGGDPGPWLSGLSVEEGLRAEHFYRERHRLIYTAMLTLIDQHDPVDHGTLCAQLDRVGELETAGGRAYVASLVSVVPVAANYRTYARRVIELARYRTVINAARKLIDGAQTEDLDLIAEAEGLLAARATGRRGPTVEERQEGLVEHVNRGRVETWPWPFPALNSMTGGMWPGHFTVLIGHSGHGKSVVADQILEAAAGRGARCCVYLTEMTTLERDLRYLARHSGVPLKKLLLAAVDDDDKTKVYRTLERALPFEIVPVGGMDARDIGRDIRRRRWDVTVIDLLNVITGREVRDIDANVGMFASLAADTGTHIVGCQHLNRARAVGHAYAPEPAVSDIRGSGAIHDLATNVVSIYRNEKTDFMGAATGEPGDDGFVNIIKVKNGTRGRVPVVFEGNKMRFLEQADARAAA